MSDCVTFVLQAAAHIHRYLSLDENILRQLIGDSKEGK